MDDYFNLLNQALSNRQNIWMFYTIIVTTALGTAFTDGYRKLTVVPRIFMTIAVGAAIWFNFYSAIVNALYVNEIVSVIRSTAEDPNIKSLFSNPLYYNQEEDLLNAIIFIYFPINIAVFVAMWWDELVIFKKWIRKKFSKVKNDEDFFDTEF